MPGAVDEHVEALEAVEQGRDRGGVGDVERAGGRLLSGGADELGGLVERRLGTADGQHGGALAGEALGDRAADAGAGAGDQRTAAS